MNRHFYGVAFVLVTAVAQAAQTEQLAQRVALERLSPLAYQVLTEVERERGSVVADGDLKSVVASKDFQRRYAAALKEFCSGAANAANAACAQPK